MFLLTQLDPTIHSKFDKNGVSDPVAASALHKRVVANFERNARDAEPLSEGTILPCSGGVWRPALARMRDERPGHYFRPIFGPKLLTEEN